MCRKQFSTILLACVLLLSCSLIPTSAAERQSSDAITPYVSGRLDHSLKPGTTPITQALYYVKDDTIKYDCTYTPKSASLDFGYIDSDNIFHYLNYTSGSINQSFKFSRTGQFTLAIRNNESYAVTVTGTVRY